MGALDCDVITVAPVGAIAAIEGVFSTRRPWDSVSSTQPKIRTHVQISGIGAECKARRESQPLATMQG